MLTFFFLNSASYRELLGTAETIIEMDGQMHEVETYLGDVGKKCNTRLLQKSGSNLHLLEGQSRMRGACCDRSWQLRLWIG